ncbi:MAG: transporter [Cyanobacteria bacterium RI_101]|nr:transporter [Cyanobacteria bacterium RI_101]
MINDAGPMKEELLTASAAAFAAFGVTNLDNLLILMFLFTQVNGALRMGHIVWGQYLGMTFLLLLSLPGFFGGLVLAPAWLGLLGFLPLGMGLSRLRSLSLGEEAPPWGIAAPNRTRKTRFFPRFSAELYSVAAITVANGGDNIGVYVPFFATLNPWQLILVLGIFYALAGLECGAAYFLASQPPIGKLINRRGKRLVPWLLIALGLWILWDSRSYEVLAPVLRS